MNIKGAILILCIVLAVSGIAFSHYYFDLPLLPQPELYGNILINRGSSGAGVKPVTFSHWSHRVNYTCRVCHYELEFNMMLNTTMITEEENRAGRFCGACHNGQLAFGHTAENCDKCHTEDTRSIQKKFSNLTGLPSSPHGNKINWVQALEQGLIRPRTYLYENEKPIQFDEKLTIKAAWYLIPPVFFSHEIHGKWLDCSNCHPELFNIKKRGTKNLSMLNILDKEFCGVCHGRVAFPIHSCRRCHPGMKQRE